MSWFDLQIENLKAPPEVASVVNADEGLDGFLALSLSALDLWVYGLLIVVAIIIAVLIIFIVKKLDGALVSAKKIPLVLAVVVAIYGAFFMLLLWGEKFGNVPEKLRDGTFGDSFGTINALFSGLAFSGVLITLLLQRQDLSEVRDQNATQQIESQFYNMLNLQQQIIQGFDLHVTRKDSAITIQGRDCFRSWRRKVRDEFGGSFATNQRPGDLERAVVAYDKIFKLHQGDLGLYFRSLYSVFKFIEGAAHLDKKHFSSVVRSLISDDELFFLFYNCLSKQGQGFRRFAINYALFDNLDVHRLIRPKHVMALEAEAFGKNAEALKYFNKQAVDNN